jgi:hypothetical protein
LYQIYKKATVSGMPRKTMIALMNAELPKTITHDQLLLHEEWYRKVQVIHAKYKDVHSKYVVARKDLVAEAKADVAAFQEIKLRELEARMVHRAQENYNNFLHAQIEQLRVQKNLENEKTKEVQRAAMLAAEEERQKRLGKHCNLL